MKGIIIKILRLFFRLKTYFLDLLIAVYSEDNTHCYGISDWEIIKLHKIYC